MVGPKNSLSIFMLEGRMYLGIPETLVNWLKLHVIQVLLPFVT